MNIKLGIIGFGGMGKWHEKNATRVDGIEIKAICDSDPTKIIDIEGKNYEIYESVDDMLAKADINTVLLTLPNHLHKEMTIKAANAGIHIIDEKPASLNVKEFDEMMEAV